MLIFVEGPDGSGKSTLVKQLLDCGAVSYQTSVDRLSNIVQEYKWYSLSNLNIVFDRSFITEIVYRIEDGKTTNSFDLFKLMSILRGKCKIIYCNNNFAFQDAMERGEDNITYEYRHKRLSSIYDDLYYIFENYSNVPIMYYDWRNNNLQDVINFIKKGE